MNKEDAILAISRYKHIEERVVLMWGTPELDEYLNQLLVDNPEGRRMGFPPDVASAIFRLITLNKEFLESKGVTTKKDIWDI